MLSKHNDQPGNTQEVGEVSLELQLPEGQGRHHRGPDANLELVSKKTILALVKCCTGKETAVIIDK